MVREVPGPRISIVRAQLGQQALDAIVNAAPSAEKLADGSSAFIWKWDRRQRSELNDLIKSKSITVGKAVAGSGGKLPARWVIHTIYPTGTTDEGFALLTSCYEDCLAVAARLGAKSIGFAKMTWPDSEYGEIRAQAARVAVSAAMSAPAPIGYVVFASPDPAMVQVYTAAHESLM